MGDPGPARALAEQRDLGGALDLHLILDRARDLTDFLAVELGERWAAVPEHPGIARVVGGEPAAHAERVEQLLQQRHRMPLARELVVVGDLGNSGVRLRVLELEARYEHPAAAVCGEHERDRPLGRDECEARVVHDVMRVEEDGGARPGEALRKYRRAAPRIPRR